MMCRTVQRAIIKQAAREGLPVWAWLIINGVKHELA